MTDCITKSSKSTNGYSTVYDPRVKKTVTAHRFVYEVAHGPIPDGMVVMHLCDNRACTNLDHLKLGTQSENLKDMYAKGRQGDRDFPLGEKHHMTKVTEEEVKKFRETPYFRGLYFQWSKLMGVSRPTARNIYLGKTWNRPNYSPAEVLPCV